MFGKLILSVKKKEIREPKQRVNSETNIKKE